MVLLWKKQLPQIYNLFSDPTNLISLNSKASFEDIVNLQEELNQMESISAYNVFTHKWMTKKI